MKLVVIKFAGWKVFLEIAKNAYHLIPKTQVFQILPVVSLKDQ